MKYDFAIIGGGVSGMTAALILSKSGRSVALVEKDRMLAPVLRGFRRRGRRYDTGFHYSGGLAEDGPLLAYFRYLGVDDLPLVPFPEDGFDEVVFEDDGDAFLFPHGGDRFRDALLERFPAEQLGILEYLGRLEHAWDSSPHLNFARPLEREAYLQRPDDLTLQAFLEEWTESAALRGILAAHTALHGVSPRDVPLHLHALVAGSYYRSAHGIAGGGGALVAAYRRALESGGVDVFCGSAVRRIDLSPSGGIQGLEMEDGVFLQTENCLLATHPGLLLDALPETVFRRAYRSRIAELKDTPSSFLLFAKGGDCPERLAKRNLLFFSTHDVADSFPPGAALDRNPMFLSRTGEGEGTVAVFSANAECIGRWRDAQQRPEAYAEFKSDMLRAACRRLEIALPEFADGMVVDDFATPLTMRDYGCWPNGALYGAEHSVARYPLLPVTKVPGLFLTGQSVVAPGVLGAVISAFVTCGCILGHGQLRREVLEWQ